MIGEKLGPFLIEDKLGSGAMGVVYRATFEGNGQKVAVKVVQADSAMKSNTSDRFQRESEILKQFRHPNIVRHIGMGFSKARNLSYYAMEYVPGRTLEAVLQERGALPWQEVVELGTQICDALQYAHERGIVHRDLKPSNLLVTEQGKLKLTDFGIAKDLDRTALTATGRTLGTAAYMAPEQIRGTPEVSHKTDLYALGCVLYEMLAGRLPFEGKSAMVLMHKHLDESPPRPSAKQPDIPLALDKLIVALMAKNRDDRPWDAAAARQVLVELRDKLERNEPIRKVFDPPPSPSASTSSPTGAATGGATRSATKSRKKARTRRANSDDQPSIPAVRRRLETALLVGGLVVGVALTAYLLWPPSAAYLHRKAAEGMAGRSRSDWILAREHYIEPLRRRFPDHPYREDVRAWLDRIALDDAQRRARHIESGGIAAVAEPSNPTEAAYRRTYRAATKDLDAHRDTAALMQWRALSAALKDDPDSRGWFLLATQRGDELLAQINARRQELATLMVQADAAARAGREAEAARLRAEALEQYAPYQSVANLLPPPPMPADAEPAPER